MRIDVWSDFRCPHCREGKRHLERALREFEHRDRVQVVWRSFEIDPSAPAKRSTFDAHRLLHLASSLEQRAGLSERFMRAAVEEDATLSDHPTLVRLAREAGLSEANVRDVLACDRFADAVRADRCDGEQAGVYAVPTFVIDGAVATAGAQPPEALWMLMEYAWSVGDGRSVEVRK